jgi:type IV secretion system protein TrbJ
MPIWKLRACVAVVFAFSMTSPVAIAGGGGRLGGVATEVTQLLNNLQLIDVAMSEAENVAYTIRQYEIMFEDARNIPTHIKQQAIADLRNLARIVATGRAVSYSSGQIDEDYQREHQNFEAYEGMRRDDGSRDHEAFNERYQDWAQVNHDSVRGALRAAGLQAQQFDREDSALRMIETQIEHGAGTKQLLQAGGSIAAMQVEQLQKLRQLQMAQIQLQSAQVGSMIDRQAEDDADIQRALRNTEVLNPNRGGGINWRDPLRPAQ